MRGFRSVVAHDYLKGLDRELVWEFLVRHLDELAAVAAAELRRRQG